MSSKNRIAKEIAHRGYCSRRQAEVLITEGQVQVNGVSVQTPATLVEGSDQISIQGKILPAASETRVWCYAKPVGLMTTHHDPRNRPTVFEQVHQDHDLPRVVSIGRLDLNSEGLLLLTNDPTFAHKAEKTRHWHRLYRVRVLGERGERPDLSPLEKGVMIDGIWYDPVKIISVAESGSGRNYWITLKLWEGKNREIRNILKIFDLKVNRLIRLEYGPYTLDALNPGEIREVIPVQWPPLAQNRIS